MMIKMNKELLLAKEQCERWRTDYVELSKKYEMFEKSTITQLDQKNKQMAQLRDQAMEMEEENGKMIKMNKELLLAKEQCERWRTDYVELSKKYEMFEKSTITQLDQKNKQMAQLRDQAMEMEEENGKIMDIGRKVHFLKMLHPAHASNEQQQSLCAQLPTNVWCTPSDISRMANILLQMHAEVSEEMSQELMGRQRLMDHLCLVHGYFFMLRGDFASALEHILL
ncbi:hypothetical protein niasHT_039935 [Heterodera trifolii]|uniref:Uncharacterized protein n=1 Tax=Heterodera trifolii TaxID=157864 RepID=A0ABD2IB09_9BILA